MAASAQEEPESGKPPSNVNDTEQPTQNEQEDAANDSQEAAVDQKDSKEEGDGGGDDDSGESGSDSDDDDESSSSEEESEDEPSSQNAAAARVTTEDGHTLSAYELQRLERIRRNKEYLASLGLEKNKPKIPAKKPKPNPARKKRPDVKRRSSISRASKDKKIVYSEFPKDQKDAAEGKPKEPWKPKKENRATRMDRFIHDEFRRIGKEQRHHLKRAQKNVRAADVEYRIVKQRAERYEKKRSRQLEFQQSAERMLEERRALGGRTARDVLQEIDSRADEIYNAIRTFDQRFNPEWARQHEENSRKMELIDAIDRFPRALKDSTRDLDVLLLERAPRDPPPPRRGTRKRKAGEEVASPDGKARAIESPDGKPELPSERWGSLSSAIASETVSSTVGANLDRASPVAGIEEETDSKPAAKPKKKKKEVSPKNVGGWVSPAFAAAIDRSWLESDTVPKKFDPSSYIPQVGDTVLYYPAGHREFLTANPDVLGKKTRNITRMTLWDRAKKEKAKLEKATSEENEDGADKTGGASKDASAKGPTWWNDEWISLMDDGDIDRYPIICRVEKTHVEFPPDPQMENRIVTKDDATGGVQVIWGVKKGGKAKASAKTTESNPSLRLAVNLRPLSSVMPPRQSEDNNDDAKTLTLPPNFNVVTFPAKESPFLVPFSWAYRLAHSLADGTSVRLASKPDWRAKIQSFNPSHSGQISGRLDDKMDSIRALCNSLKNGPKSFAASLEEALRSDKRASLPLTDACAVIERFEAALEANGTDASKESENTDSSTLMTLIRSTLPLWNGVLVGSGSGRTLEVSAWDLVLTDSKAYVPTGPLLSISSDIEMETGLVYAIDEPLRMKIECAVEDFLKDTPDAAMFCPLISDEDAESYSCAVPRGMAFDKIFSRLRSGKKSGNSRCYYRTVDSLLGDLSAILDNCVLYNAADSFVVQKALEVIPSVKKLVAQVASQHFKEKEAIEKSIEERRQAIALQCNAPALLNGESQGASTSRSRGAMKRIGLPPPYTEPLHRSWIQDTQPDRSWHLTEGSASNSRALDTLGASSWVPQRGDTILYSRSLHTDFVKAHHPSLTTEQCELPVFSGEMNNVNASESQDAEGDATGTSLSDELQNRWLVGKVMWVRASFPRAPSKRDTDYENTFEVATPVLDLGIRFSYSWASNRVYEVSWRPCTFEKEEVIDHKPAPTASPRSKRIRAKDSDDVDPAAAASDSSKPMATPKCNACQMSANSSFVRPGWIPLTTGATNDADGSTPYVTPDIALSAESLLSPPRGISSEMIGSIDRCLNVLKRRCLDGVPADYIDPKCTAQNVKNGWNPPAPKIGKSLPAFDRVLVKGNTDSKESSTRGIEKVDKKAITLLAQANYLPQWTSSLSEGTKKKTNRDGIAQSLALHETLSPAPNLCLELIQTRLRNGYYRSSSGLSHDIQEAYVSSVLLLLAKPATAKQGQAVSIRRIAKALSVANDSVSFAKPSGKKGANAEALAAIDSAALSGLSEKEKEWFEKVLHIRKLYGTALACVYQPMPMERIFGSVPKKKIVVMNETMAADREQVFNKARNTLGFIHSALQRDMCDNRPATSWLPSVKVKIRFSGQESLVDGAKEDENEDGENICTTRPILITTPDYESNETLVKFFFGRPLRMASCGRCSAYGRSTLLCRVYKKHSQPDFDWVTVFEGSGGIDGLLYSLRTGQPPPTESAVTDVASEQLAAMLPSSAGTENGAAAASEGANEPDPLALLEKAEAAVAFADKVLEKAEKFSKDPVRLSEEFVDAFFPIDSTDQHYNYCILCGLIGDVICCEGCPNVVHPHCINLSEIPDEDWFCARCRRKGKGKSKDADTNVQKVMNAEENDKDSERDPMLQEEEKKASEEMNAETQDPSASQEPSSGTVSNSSLQEEKNDAVESSESPREPTAASIPADSSKEETKDDERRPESKMATVADTNADVLPATMAAPYGLDDDADKLEAMLGELKAARPVKPKKPKRDKSAESKEGEGDEGEDEDDIPDSQDKKPKARRSSKPEDSPPTARRSARSSSEGLKDGAESEGEDEAPEEYRQVGPQPQRIRVGTKVTKKFGGHGYFTGKVLEIPSAENPFYLVRYEDDDEEDMTEEELRKCILGPSVASRPSTGSKRTRRSGRASSGNDVNDEEPTDSPASSRRRSGRSTRATVAFSDDDEGEPYEPAATNKKRRPPPQGRPNGIFEVGCRVKVKSINDAREGTLRKFLEEKSGGRSKFWLVEFVDEENDNKVTIEEWKSQQLTFVAKPAGASKAAAASNDDEEEEEEEEEEEVPEPTAGHSHGTRSRSRSRASIAPEEPDVGGESSEDTRSARTRKKRGATPMKDSDRPSKRERSSSSKASPPPKKRGRGRPRKQR